MNLLKSIGLYRRLNHQMYRMKKSEIEKIQLKRLKQLVKFVKEESPYYSEQYKNQSIESFSDYEKLPTMNKSIMMNEFDRINTVGIHREDCMEYAIRKELNKEYLGYYKDQFVVGLSSGTSGNKGLFITPKKMTKQIPSLFLARGGIKLTDLPVRILFMLRVFSQGFEDINAPFIKLSYLSTMTKVDEIISTAKEKRINILMAPPSLIRELLPSASLLPRFKRIITYAEVLEKEEKARFGKTFQTDIVEIYQASEGQIASPCKCGNLHINEDLVYVELFSESGNVVTEPGVIASKMIVTNLINEAQPLLRYEMNDVIVLGGECPCGSSFRRIDHIIGRNDDVFRFMNQKGEMIAVYPDLISRWIITVSDEIREFIATQTRIDTVDLLIDALPSEHLKEAIQSRFEGELAAFDIRINVNVEFSKIEKPEGNKKMKRFINLIKQI